LSLSPRVDAKMLAIKAKMLAIKAKMLAIKKERERAGGSADAPTYAVRSDMINGLPR
jgi:hypothetical protein